MRIQSVIHFNVNKKNLHIGVKDRTSDDKKFFVLFMFLDINVHKKDMFLFENVSFLYGTYKDYGIYFFNYELYRF